MKTNKKAFTGMIFAFWLLFGFSAYTGPADVPVPYRARAKKEDPEKKKFQDAIRGLEKKEGLFTFYEGKKNLYLEFKPEQLGKEFLFLTALEKGLGVRGFLGGLSMDEFVVVFRQEGEQIFLIRKNPYFTVKKGSELERAVEHAFTDSLMATFPISAKNPDAKSVLIDLRPFLLSDYVGMKSVLKNRFNASYRLNSEGSYIPYFKVFPQNAELGIMYHFQTDDDVYIEGIPDARSLWLGIRYSISDLPETSDYVPRFADDRVGHFYVAIKDFTQTNPKEPFVRYIIRWNLKKANPDAERSAPVKPIVFWVENTTPKEYRQAVIDGILMWNKAFEQIGFENGIEARIQPDDADWDPADVRYNTVRWIISSDISFAGVGPARVHPVTGEILDADVLIEGEAIRSIQWLYKLQIEPRTLPFPRFHYLPFSYCDYSALLAQEVSESLLAYSVLSGKGEVPKDFVEDYIRRLVGHEIGHVLGLRHNFKGSLLHDEQKQLHQTDITGKMGLSSSIMDYLPVNLAPPGVPQGDFFTKTIGEYDMWAIEYAYFPTNAKTPEEELPVLQGIASRAGQEPLRYGTDEDTFGWSEEPYSGDPFSQWWDLGANPIDFAQNRIAIAKELKEKIPEHLTQQKKPFEDFRYALSVFLGMMRRSAHALAKFVGGVEFSRVHQGDSAEKPPLNPVPAKMQEKALYILQKEIFSDEPFTFPPELLQKAHLSRWLHWGRNIDYTEPLEYPLVEQVTNIRRSVLSRLLHPRNLQRIQKALYMQKAQERPKGIVVDIPFLVGYLDKAVWQDLWDTKNKQTPIALSVLRKEFQVLWVQQLVSLYTSRNPDLPSEASITSGFLLREISRKIQDLFLTVGDKLDYGTFQHLTELKARIDRALEAVVLFPSP